LKLTADELDFLGGANSIRGTKKFEIRAATPVWTYRLGTSAEGAGGGIIDPIYAPGMLDLPTRDIEALADGFTLIDIGSSAAGNEMKIGDLFNMTKVKFTDVPAIRGRLDQGRDHAAFGYIPDRRRLRGCRKTPSR
jgi:hypothetical protein